MEMGLLVTVAREERFRPFYGQAKEREGFDGPLQDRSNMFESKCVCISRKDLLMLKKSLFRITRGNSWIYEMDIRLDELNNYFGLAKHRTLADQILKNRILCLVVYQKGERNVLQSKINRFFGCLDCHILMAEINNLREELPRMEKKIVEIESMEELTLEGIKKHVNKLAEVREGSTVSWLAYMEMYTKKEREIYRALSTTNVSKNLVRFNLYIPSKDLPLNIQPKMNLPPLILNVKETDKMLPSKFDTNYMLQVPQEIVNTYGVPSH